MIIFKIITMILIPIGAILLVCFLLYKIWDSNLPVWLIAALMFITAGVLVIGTINLEVYLYYLWFGAV